MGPHIHTGHAAPRTRAHAADRVLRIAVVLASPCVVPAARGPVALAAKLVAGHGAGDEREPRPGRPDAAGPPGWSPDGRDAGRVHGDPGDPGPGDGRQPGIIQRGPAPGTRWGSPVRSRSPGRRRCGCPARPYPNPAVTLSDMGGQGERSPSRRYARQPWRGSCVPDNARMIVLSPAQLPPTASRRGGDHNDRLQRPQCDRVTDAVNFRSPR